MARHVLLLVACVVLAGCSAPIGPPTADAPGEDWTWPEDPAEDRLGWEAGVWHNESIAVDQSDGLDELERELLVARTMARVEVIRGLEFRTSVPVEVISRAEFRNRSNYGGGSDASRAWNDQVWEALLLVGEDREVADVFAAVYGGGVQGYYSPGQDAIVIVSDGEDPRIDRVTLAHELVHALQDQHFGLDRSPATQDGQLARDGLVEGDAAYVEQRYQERCEDTWECVDRPQQSGGAGIDDRNLGVFLAIYHPYSDGPHFVHRLRERGGWAAVDAAYRSQPRSTEQVIHPEKYPAERPVSVSVRDRSSGDWQRFDLDRQADTVGEASVFAMFWFQEGIDRSTLTADVDTDARYDYDHEFSAGWAGDTVVPYRNGDEFGYVWRLEWDTPRDAREFHAAYVDVLTARLNATEVRDGVYRVPADNPFGDAFRVTRNGTTVTIVNAPSASDLDDVHESG